MTWAEFRQWAWDTYGYQIKGGRSKTDYAWTVVITGSDPARYRRASFDGPGSGNDFDYGVKHQRRFATWLRARDLIDRDLASWLHAAEPHEDGWLINTGDGIEWQATPDWLKLIEIGCFVGIRCGI